MFGIVKDSLSGLLALTVLQKTEAVAASAVVATAREVDSLPLASALILTPISCPAAHTLDVVVHGRDNDADAWELVTTFVQVTNANIANQRANVERPFKQYRVTGTAAGAFGGAGIPYTVHHVGTNVQRQPVTQVD